MKELERENGRLKTLLVEAELDKAILRERSLRETSDPGKAATGVRDLLGRDRVSERRACKVVGQYRSTQRRVRHVPCNEPRLIHEMTELALQYGCYGYRMVTGLLNQWYGWDVNHKRVARLWRRKGLQISKKQPKRRRLWLNDGSCIRLRR